MAERFNFKGIATLILFKKERIVLMEKVNFENKNITNRLLKPIMLFILLLITSAILIFYFVVSNFGLINEWFLYTAPFYIILCFIAFFSKFKISWAPVSLFLYAIYCLFNTYLNQFHNKIIILLGIGVLLDFTYLIIDNYSRYFYNLRSFYVIRVI